MLSPTWGGRLEKGNMMYCLRCSKDMGPDPDDAICLECDGVVTHDERARFREVAAERAREEARLYMSSGVMEDLEDQLSKSRKE